MKIAQSVFVVLGLLTFLTQADATSLSEITNEKQWIEGILNWDDNVPISESINEKHLHEADVFIQQGSLNPIVYYLRGRFGFGKRGFYHRNLLKEGKPYRLDAPENQALIKEYQSYYRKALDLDDSPDAPAHLDPKMLQSMATDVLAPPDIAKRALRKALDISIVDGRSPFGGEVGNYELELYEFFLGTYADEGDNKLYLATINEVLERYPNYRTEELLEYKRNVEAMIAKQQQAAAQQDNYAQADTYTQPKAVVVQQPVKAVEPKQAEVPKASKETPASEHNTMLWWLLGGVGLLGVIMLLMRRKKS